MAQSNLAREPSMDEILASIRRIIENNDAVGPGQPANDIGEGYRSDRPYGEDDLEEIELTIDEEMLAAEFDAAQNEALGDASPVDHRASTPVEAPRVAPPEPAARTVAQPIAPPPLSLADVAARVRAASDRQMVRPEPQREPPVLVREPSLAAVPTEAPQPVGVAEPVNTDDQTQKRTVRETPIAHALARHPLLTDAAPSQPATPLAEPAAEKPVAEALNLAAAPVSESAERPLPAILSAAVGEQVSRAFSDLALAVDSSPRRSFDEIAEDMLRPMLQEWLDDNLPTLVERLVREEIERVARGPRR